MATFRLRRFSNPEVLRAIAPRRLIAFLQPHRTFFEARGLVFPRAPSIGPTDYEALVDLFMDPEAGLPKDLLDALFLVDEMATPHGMDALLNTPGLSLEESDEDSPADIAVQAWLLDRHLLESKHAEQFLVRPRSFECYQTGRAKVPPFTLPDTTVCGNLERDLDDWFEEKKRGRGTRVFVYPREDGVWFLVRHGEPFKREESLNGSETANKIHQPVASNLFHHAARRSRHVGAAVQKRSKRDNQRNWRSSSGKWNSTRPQRWRYLHHTVTDQPSRASCPASLPNPQNSRWSNHRHQASHKPARLCRRTTARGAACGVAGETSGSSTRSMTVPFSICVASTHTSPPAHGEYPFIARAAGTGDSASMRSMSSSSRSSSNHRR